MIHHSATVDSSFMFTISLSDGVPYTVDGGMVLQIFIDFCQSQEIDSKKQTF